MSVQEIKLDLIQTILQIQEPELLRQAAGLLQEFISGKTSGNGSGGENEEFDANEMSFEEWNKQFDDDRDLQENIPEHGMTLGEFRRKIYEAERSEYLTEEEFHKELKTMRNELKTKYSL